MENKKQDWIRALLEYARQVGHKTTCPKNLSKFVVGNECDCGWDNLKTAVERTNG